MGSVHARGDTFLTFGLKALTETNTSRLATGSDAYLPACPSSVKLPKLLCFKCGIKGVDQTCTTRQ
jgi:hypothetical protein